MIVRTNILSINSHRNLGLVSNQQSRSAGRLASGFRINSAADDAAGLGISEKMRAQIRGLNQASRNAQDGISAIQVAEAGLDGVLNKIHRIRELTVQGANDTNAQADRDAIAQEIWQLSAEILDTEDRLDFNTMRLLRTVNEDLTPNIQSIDGMSFQVGANFGQRVAVDLDLGNNNRFNIPLGYTTTNQSILFITSSMLNHAALALEGRYGYNSLAGRHFNYSGDTANNFLGSGGAGPTANDLLSAPGGDVGMGRTQTEWISAMLGNIDAAFSNITTMRSTLGALQNRLEFTIQQLDISSENLSAADSRIRDADMAKEMMRLTQSNVLQQAATSMLAQANQAPQSVLQLLQ